MQEIQGECYLLLCKDAPVTVLSQQIRALNLAYALHGKESISGKRIAVIGAGAGGLTFAAASAILGAKWVIASKSTVLLGERVAGTLDHSPI